MSRIPSMIGICDLGGGSKTLTVGKLHIKCGNNGCLAPNGKCVKQILRILVAPLTDDHESGGLKQQIFLLSRFWRSEVQKPRHQYGCIPQKL